MDECMVGTGFVKAGYGLTIKCISFGDLIECCGFGIHKYLCVSVTHSLLRAAISATIFSLQCECSIVQTQ